ncbi:MAG: 4'-phosphopantetheinyl transferase superfamily protein [Oscillospiraceae bacterium]|nr:4'-phosphopantetheinyl transferase superfamily protein [Oscillospiraceae bacterium]
MNSEDKMIYICDDLNSYSDELYEEHLRSVVPAWRKAAVSSYRSVEHRKQSVLAIALLSLGLRREYNVSSVPEFQFNEYGKPSFAKLPVCFSLSHCARAVVCAVSERNVGIDAERVVPYDARIARRVCNAAELAGLETSAAPDVLFSRYWTTKEAISKFEGLGLGMDFRTITPASYATFCCHHPDKGYTVSVCCGKRGTATAPPPVQYVSPRAL